MHSGSVAIIGRTNVGKSTFLNGALKLELATTSPLPQTTRDELLGVVQRDEAEIAFMDTPGLHRPKTELGRRMNAAALSSLRSSDVVVFVTCVTRLSRRPKRSLLPGSDPIEPDDRRLLDALPKETPTILVVNKVDLLRDKSRLLPLLTAFSEAHPFAAIVPVTLLDPLDIERVLREIEKLLPEGERRFGTDTLTDRPMSYFAREYVREQVLRRARSEVPHAVAVSIDRFEQRPNLSLISATIHVEKSGQGSILVGHGGQTIKAIGIGARERIEALIGTRVHLELFVRVSERWKDTPRQLSELGYDHSGRTLANLLPEQSAPTRAPKPKPDPKAKAKAKAKAKRGPKPNRSAGASSDAKSAKTTTTSGAKKRHGTKKKTAHGQRPQRPSKKQRGPRKGA